MRYVLHYYKEGKLDTQRALDKIQTRTGIRPKTAKHLYLRWTAIAASVLVAVSLGTYLYLKPSTTTLTAEATQQVYRLPDGTIVTLAPHATLSYEGDCRVVEMTGKAFFAVEGHEGVQVVAAQLVDEYVDHHLGHGLLGGGTLGGGEHRHGREQRHQ